MGTIFKWVNILLSIGIFFIALGVLYATVPYFGNQALVVRSGSMSPAINAGSIVVVRPNTEFISPIVSTPLYHSGDVIAFRSENNSKTIITHRIVGSTVKDDNVLYKTKGDANDDVDGWVVNQKDIVGKSFFTVPYAGYILAFAKSDTGFPLLIIVPAVFVVLLELFNIIREIRGVRKTRVAELRTHLRHPHHALGLKIFVPLLIIGVSIPIAFAFPMDTETSSNNVFTAAEDFFVNPSLTPTPTPTDIPFGIADHIVISEVQIDGGNGQDNDNDFIELYNPTSSSVNLNGFRLVKRTGGSGSDSNIFTFTSSHIIPAHGYFLWGHQSGGQNPNTFATTIGADVFSTDTLGASNSVAIRQGDLNTGTVIDALSWDPGASTLKEGTEFPDNPQEDEGLERKALSTSTAGTMGIGGADEFKGNGFDLNDNSTDFILRTLSQPQNSGSAPESPN